MAETQEQLGFFDDAEQNYKECLRKRREVYGEQDEASVSYTLYSLDILLGNKEAFQEAAEMYTECLEMELRLYGEKVDNLDIA